MPKYPITDASGNVIQYVEAPTYEMAIDAFMAEQSGIGSMEPPPSEGEPGTSMAGFGAEGEMAEKMAGQSGLENFEQRVNAGVGRGLSGASFGLIPAMLSRVTGGEYDKQEEEERATLGPNASSLIELGAGVLSPANAYTPLSILTKANQFKPGVMAAFNRIFSGAGDAALIQGTNMGIRGESPFLPMQYMDTVKNAGSWGLGLEVLLGAKRIAAAGIGGKWGGTAEQKALDKAIEAVKLMVKTKGAKGKVTDETMVDVLGPGWGPKTAASLKTAAPEEFGNLAEQHAARLSQRPSRIRAAAEKEEGGPLKSPSELARDYANFKFKEDKEFVPLFERNPTVKKESFWARTSPKKTQVTAPKGFGQILKDPDALAAWQAASEEGRRIAKSYALRDGRKMPGELENAWHTALVLEKSGNTELANYGSKLKDTLRSNHPELDALVRTEANIQQRGRAVETGSEAIAKPHLLDERKWELDADPMNRRAVKTGVLSDIAERAEKGGDKVPIQSTQLSQTLTRTLGADTARRIDDMLGLESRRQKIDKPLADDRGAALPGAEPKIPKSFAVRGAGALARGAVGGILGGPAGMLWSAPYFAKMLGANPNKMMSELEASSILKVLGLTPSKFEAAAAKVRKQNIGETKLNTKLQVPLVTTMTETDRADRRNRSRKARKQIEEFEKEN